MNIKSRIWVVSILMCFVFLLVACGQEEMSTNESMENEPMVEHSNLNSEPVQEPEPTQESEETKEPEPVNEPTEPNKPVTVVSAKEHTVEIINFAFSPQSLEINIGDTVIFVNKDDVAHTATADDGSFDTGMLKKDKEDQVTFNTTGEFSYFCLPHPGMKAMIKVLERS